MSFHKMNANKALKTNDRLLHEGTEGSRKHNHDFEIRYIFCYLSTSGTLMRIKSCFRKEVFLIISLEDRRALESMVQGIFNDFFLLKLTANAC